MAWLTIRTDLPLRRLWAVLAPLPLVFPSFVGAAALLAAFAPGGLFAELFDVPADRLPTVEGFSGAWFVLTLFTYPYVYLPVAARLGALPASLEESARLLGAPPWRVFRTVVVPQISGAVWAGALLVFLYTVSEFGAVAQLRYNTMTVEIFESRLADRSLALGLVLALVAVTVVLLERLHARSRIPTVASSNRPSMRWEMGRLRWIASAAVLFVVGNALLGPLVVLGWWAGRGLTGTGQLAATDFGDLASPAFNTAGLGVAAALITVAVVLPVAYLSARHRTRVGAVASAVVTGSFALPGLLIALALVFWVLQAPVVGGLYQTVPLLLTAYAVHFGAQALRAAQVAVAGVPSRLDDAARMLGAGRVRRFRTIDLPLMVPGLLAGAGLVLLSTVKELPATLLLRPTSVDTLAVHIWQARESAQWAETGLASLALVALSGVLTWFLVIRRAEHAG